MGVRLILDESGVPQPPSDLLARLRERVHPSCGLKYSAGAWAVTWDWPENDRRWAAVRSGEWNPGHSHDIVAFVPVEVPLDQVPAYLERSMRGADREDVRNALGRIQHWNDTEPAREAVEEVVAATLADEAAQRNPKKGRRTRVTVETTP